MGEVRRRRPWLAVLLALVISGLGHAYLRRWGRALGWYVAITITLVVLVPDAAVDQLFTGTAPPVGDLLPALVVILASVIDAYVLAIRNNREYERRKHDPEHTADDGRGNRNGADAADGAWSGDQSPGSPAVATGAEVTSGTGVDPDAKTEPTRSTTFPSTR